MSLSAKSTLLLYTSRDADSTYSTADPQWQWLIKSKKRCHSAAGVSDMDTWPQACPFAMPEINRTKGLCLNSSGLRGKNGFGFPQQATNQGKHYHNTASPPQQPSSKTLPATPHSTARCHAAIALCPTTTS